MKTTTVSIVALAAAALSEWFDNGKNMVPKECLGTAAKPINSIACLADAVQNGDEVYAERLHTPLLFAKIAAICGAPQYLAGAVKAKEYITTDGKNTYKGYPSKLIISGAAKPEICTVSVLFQKTPVDATACPSTDAVKIDLEMRLDETKKLAIATFKGELTNLGSDLTTAYVDIGRCHSYSPSGLQFSYVSDFTNHKQVPNSVDAYVQAKAYVLAAATALSTVF